MRVKDALALFKCRGADKYWTVRKNINAYRNIKAWDDDNFQMSNSDIKVRFIKFIEEIHTGDKIEIKEGWIITTDKFILVETLWKVMHKRWDIENNVFHKLKTKRHLDHWGTYLNLCKSNLGTFLISLKFQIKS